MYDEEFQAALDESGGDQDYAAFAENHRFLIPEGCHWRDVQAHTVNVGQALSRALREIEKANPGRSTASSAMPNGPTRSGCRMRSCATSLTTSRACRCPTARWTRTSSARPTNT